MALLASDLIDLELAEKAQIQLECQQQETAESIAKIKARIIASMKAAGVEVAYFGRTVYLIGERGPLRCCPARYLGDLEAVEPVVTPVPACASHALDAALMLADDDDSDSIPAVLPTCGVPHEVAEQIAAARESESDPFAGTDGERWSVTGTDPVTWPTWIEPTEPADSYFPPNLRFSHPDEDDAEDGRPIPLAAEAVVVS